MIDSNSTVTLKPFWGVTVQKSRKSIQIRLLTDIEPSRMDSSELIDCIQCLGINNFKIREFLDTFEQKDILYSEYESRAFIRNNALPLFESIQPVQTNEPYRGNSI